MRSSPKDKVVLHLHHHNHQHHIQIGIIIISHLIIINVIGHLVDELLELLLGKVVQLHLKSERLLCDGLVRGVIVLERDVRQAGHSALGKFWTLKTI